MLISVIGCGYLGTVHAACMASLGHEVIAVDVDTRRIEQLENGIAPFFEPGLQDVLSKTTDNGTLRFATEMNRLSQATVHFIAVGTPQLANSAAADMSYVDAAVAGLLPYLKPGDLVVGKSTVPVGTASRLASCIADAGATLVWNPEFLREGFAVQDTLRPDRLVYGVPSGQPGVEAARLLDEVYAEALAELTPRIVTDFATAELVKVSANAFLATKISFINAMAEIAEVTGANVTELADAIGHDTRIGRRFLGAGIGFGGGCLPKDIRAFTARAEELGRGSAVAFLKEVDAINIRRRERAVSLIVEGLGGRLLGKRVAVLGASFKPHSDDVRDSPALYVANRLNDLGAEVVVTDPQAIENARAAYPQLKYDADRDGAICGADAIVLVTEWDEYRRELEPQHASTLTGGRLIVDGRNCLDAQEWRDAGWIYRGMGQP